MAGSLAKSRARVKRCAGAPQKSVASRRRRAIQHSSARFIAETVINTNITIPVVLENESCSRNYAAPRLNTSSSAALMRIEATVPR